VDHVEKLVRRFPDLPLDPPDTAGLEPREAALGHAIVEAVIRRWLVLDYLIEQGLKMELEELEPRVRAILLCGAAQMLLLERVPIRAALHESVEIGKRGRHDAGGLVNAALRRMQELLCEHQDAPVVRVEGLEDTRKHVPMSDGKSVALTREGLPEDRLHRLSIATSCPLELLRMLARSMSLDEVRRVALHSIYQPPTVFRTTWSEAELPTEIFIPHDTPGHHVFCGSYRDLRELVESRSDIWVQDSASSEAIDSIRDLKPSTIVDVCAGKGTKTRQLSHVFPEARIVATDINSERWQLLRASFEGHARVEVVAFEKLDALAQGADLILLDVPCSNTGVLARRVEARYRAGDRSKLESLVQMQRQIMADAMRLLAPGGAVLYSTCSLDPRENEEQLEWSSRWHNLEVDLVRRALPAGGPGEPGTAYSDGSFSGLLRG
jgi:16S rRNA (cytosine967-C5)-methyltransferase